ncbi:hypothetical protein HYQ46_004074 [Verticillium longisporum]|nr:hypothetical protein HYQ46_004074 [Verticillium longisporum]
MAGPYTSIFLGQQDHVDNISSAQPMSSTEPSGPHGGSNGDPAAPAPPAVASAAVSANPELDLPKLQSLPADQQQLFLLTSVAALTKHVLALSNDDCTAQQFYLKKEVFQVINLTTPQPTRVVRNNLGKCLAHIFGHGDRKLLFETINDLVSITQGGKGKAESSQRAKHAAVVCLGDVFASAGDTFLKPRWLEGGRPRISGEGGQDGRGQHGRKHCQGHLETG